MVTTVPKNVQNKLECDNWFCKQAYGDCYHCTFVRDCMVVVSAAKCETICGVQEPVITKVLKTLNATEFSRDLASEVFS